MFTAKKICAAFLAATLFVSSLAFTGCKKKGNEEKISENDVWYSVHKARIGEQFLLETDVETSYSRFIGAADDKAVFLTDIIKMYPQGMSSDLFDYDDLHLNYVEIYGKDGNLERTINIKQRIKESGIFKLDPADYPEVIERVRKEYENKGISTADKTDKQLFDESGVKVSYELTDNYSVKSGFLSLTVLAFYPSSQSLTIDNRVIDIVFSLNTGEIVRYDQNKEKSFLEKEIRYAFDDYEIVYKAKKENGKHSHYFDVNSLSDGRGATIVGDSIFGGDDNASISSMIYLGEGKALITVRSSEFGKAKYYEMLLATATVTEAVTDYSWIEYDLDSASYVDGVGYVICDDEGLKKIDFKNKSKVEVFSFDSCDINRSESLNMKLLAMTENSIFLMANNVAELSSVFSPADFGDNLYVLTKETTNPNAGKTVIHASVMSFFTYPVCEAVLKFNESNPDYYIKLDNDYSTNKYVNNGTLRYLDDDYAEKETKLSAELSYQLAIDLMNGDGPDIVLEGAGFPHLNNSNYFLDLKKEVKTDGLFDNIVKASETDGKLYQFPLCVTLTGIVVSKKDVAEDQYGFTFDQYKDLVAGPCNGADPISIYADQTEYFIRCMHTMKDSYMENGKVNFDTPAFRALAEYTKENVSVKKIPGADELFMKAVENNKRSVRYEVGLTMPYLVRFLPDSITEMKVMGLPSYDGRGPSMTVSASVGISASTKEKKACLEFVKVLLSDEIQESYGLYSESTPVKKTAYESVALKAIEKYNSVYKKYKHMYSREQLFEMNYPFCEIDTKAVGDYEKMVLSSTVKGETDPAISIIVREEIPAYLTGQKSLDDVIKIINDRAQTYVNEREGK